ncbi:hypothetical protein DPMN_131047 [Dreissena polymorpha]|uniref:Uncharacterized protein n=2 Tax=Dreissena polymorpha TaxID=45954 RepID=A0A9D4H3X4_DREPO|nr:hypothetical protein DPMN_131047 [Dreissena polymorpha]
METLLKNEAVRAKIKGLSPPVKKAFIESLLDLFEQETEDTIDLIEESRMELRGDFMSFDDDTKSLRAESRMLEDQRKGYEQECVENYMKTRTSDSRLSVVDEKENSRAVSDYIKKRGKRRAPLADEIKRSQSTDRPLDVPRRSDSSLTTRSLPSPATLRTVEEEKDEIMNTLTTANRQKEAERLRQLEIIEARRTKRRQQKQTTEEKALELLEKAVAMDKMLSERKLEQDQQLQERLEDARRKRAESRVGNYDDSKSMDSKSKSRSAEGKELREDKRTERPPESDRIGEKDRTSERDDKREKRSEREKDKRDRSDREKEERRGEGDRKSEKIERTSESDGKREKRSEREKDKSDRSDRKKEERRHEGDRKSEKSESKSDRKDDSKRDNRERTGEKRSESRSDRKDRERTENKEDRRERSDRERSDRSDRKERSHRSSKSSSSENKDLDAPKSEKVSKEEKKASDYDFTIY